MGWSLMFALLLISLVGIGFGFSETNTKTFSRDDFPSDFVFGAGTSAYQVEGAAAEDGRTPSIWDTYTHAGNMPDKSSGDKACDGYHKYKEISRPFVFNLYEDVKLMSDIGLEAYRFSISWSRLLPNGRGAVNPKGLEYYNNLIDELVSHGIQPHVTLYHLDLPQILEDEYGSWLSPKIVEDFTAYADVCFREFGDRVAHWTTLNEPNILAISSYDTHIFPPEQCAKANCIPGNTSVEPYIAMHYSLLAHASAAALYKEKYQVQQKGVVGINVYAFWCIPLTNSTADLKASQRAIDYFTGWVVDPVVFGDYPKIMKKNAGSRIPSFTKEESKLVKGSADFIGLNHYFTIYIKDNPNNPATGVPDYNADMAIELSATKDPAPPGQFDPTAATTLDPSGLQSLFQYFKDYYGNPPVFIHENGSGGPQDETLNDTARIDYLTAYIGSTLDGIRNGANVKGYFLWSFMDVFEFLSGYQMRYGIVHVDFNSKELKRRFKSSALWYSNLINKKEGILKMNKRNETSGRMRKIWHFSN
ncbi:hypothetical protein GIB67_021817 [Kingdonia uniflora]|uniref:Beta-glucosidase n=1 Tax=Kingdonia uniflora TaxID=39325 RepID=A0A7J7P7S2_9MAGN|nr:hypothetical protein GIB67_021817 [Kingdonia uniflora]